MDLEHLCLNCMQEGLSGEGKGTCRYCKTSSPLRQNPMSALPLQSILHGQYLIGRQLGHGGFGITYIALDLQSGMRVAIKEYMPNGVGARTAGKADVQHLNETDFSYGLKRFIQEARIINSLKDTPNIVRIVKLFEENQTAYFAMEYLDGMDLKHYLDRFNGKLNYETAVSLLLPIIECLVSVHAMGVIHRDISPDNIFLLKSNVIKLFDFGAAHSALGEKSVSYNVLVKRGYAPIEQYMTNGRQGPWTDVYAMAATLYRCITGEVPPESTMRINGKAQINLAAKGCKLTKRQEQVLMHGLAVNAADRFINMKDFAAALRQSLPNGTVPVPVPADMRRGANGELESNSDKTVLPTPITDVQVEPVKPQKRGFWFFNLFRRKPPKGMHTDIVPSRPQETSKEDVTTERNPVVNEPARDERPPAVHEARNERSTQQTPKTARGNAAPQPISYRPTGQQYCLFGLTGQYAGDTIALYSDPLRFGRDQDRCALLYPKGTPGVSNIHCGVWYDAASNQVLVEDYGSRYGTHIGQNHWLKPHEPERINDGESFGFGSESFTVTRA